MATVLLLHFALMVAINVAWWRVLRMQQGYTDYWHGEAMKYLSALGWDRDEQERKRRQRPDRRRV